MKTIFLLLSCLLAIGQFSQIYGQTSNFKEKPWTKEIFPIIIDPYQGNKIDFEKLVTDHRVAAIIHKASQGLNADKKYIERSKIAQSKNILFASYHLGTNADPTEQADYYLNVVRANLGQPMALDIEDFEDNQNNNAYMTLDNAAKFIARIYEKTKTYPIIYVNNKVFKQINLKYGKNSIFAKCPLWYARFLDTLPYLSTKIWDDVAIWQFSCELNCSKTGNCLYNVAGTEYDIDVNAFNGDKNELQLFWSRAAVLQEFTLDEFIRSTFKNSISYNKIQIKEENTFECGYTEAYLVEGFNANHELKDRYMIYKRNGKYIISDDFIKWCADQINFFNLPEFGDLEEIDQKNNALNRMDIIFNDNSEFIIDFHSDIPENIPDESTAKYVTFRSSSDIPSYGFPTGIECE